MESPQGLQGLHGWFAAGLTVLLAVWGGGKDIRN